MEKVVRYEEILAFYKGKKILVTGHTGFKGSWLCEILKMAGAQVTGYALPPNTSPALFEVAKVANGMNSVIGDVTNYDSLKQVFVRCSPEIVLHLAAQPIVKIGYSDPIGTYNTNVMGTVNLLECCRQTNSVKSVLNVTTDKVYENKEWQWGYRENEPLDGYDPYSNSKSCSELVTHCYKNSYFNEMGVAVSTARAGNVIGGGDFSPNRIVPDCVRAMQGKTTIVVRNPYSTRPYQHVLEPLLAYLMIAKQQYECMDYCGYYNVGPDDCDCVTTGDLVDIFCRCWGEEAMCENKSEDNAPHEANFLKLDCSKIKAVFNWKPQWHIYEAIEQTCFWSKAYLAGKDMGDCMRKQIQAYIGEI